VGTQRGAELLGVQEGGEEGEAVHRPPGYAGIFVGVLFVNELTLGRVARVDSVDRLRADWHRELPDLDVAPIAVAGRVTRIAALLDARAEAELAADGLSRGEFDLLCALRRAGRPLRASEVSTITAASGAAITKRADALVRAGLVERSVPSRDRRGVLLALTAAGRDAVDRLMPAHLAREADALAGLTPAETERLAALLSRVLVRVEGGA
jgi:DNA-binding MarR family transcriptional regulator